MGKSKIRAPYTHHFDPRFRQVNACVGFALKYLVSIDRALLGVNEREGRCLNCAIDALNLFLDPTYIPK